MWTETAKIHKFLHFLLTRLLTREVFFLGYDFFFGYDLNTDLHGRHEQTVPLRSVDSVHPGSGKPAAVRASGGSPRARINVALRVQHTGQQSG